MLRGRGRARLVASSWSFQMVVVTRSACSPSAARACGSAGSTPCGPSSCRGSPGPSSLMGLGTIVLDRVVKLYFHVEEIFVGCVAGVARARRRGARCTARGWRPAQGRPLRARVADRRHRPPGDGADRAVRDPPRGRDPRRRARRLGPRGAGRRAVATLWLANYADADEVLAARRRRRRRAVLERHQPGAARRADPRRAGPRSRPVPRPGPVGHRLPARPALPIAHQPLLYVESPSLSRLQVSFKRAFDVACRRRCWSCCVAAAGARSPCSSSSRTAARCCSGSAASGATASSSRCSSSARCASTPRPGWPRSARRDNERTGPLFKLEATTRGSRGSAGSCGRRASTSCRSCSTCCAAT